MPPREEIIGHLPMVVIDPLDMSRPPQRLQTADMEVDERLGILVLLLKAVLDTRQMLARAVDPAFLRGIDRDVAVSGSWAGHGGNRLHDHAAPDLLDAGGVSKLQVVDAPVDTVDHEINPFAHLVASQPLGQHAADDALVHRAAMADILADPARLGQPMIGERPVHGLYDIAPLAELPKRRFGAVGQNPPPGLSFSGEAIALQPLHPSGHQRAAFPDEIACTFARSEVDRALVALLGQQHPVEPGQPLGVHLAPELGLELDLALVTQFQGDQFARPEADAVGNIVARNIEDLAVVGDTPDQDVGMRVAGVVVIDRNPVEPGRHIDLHLAHQRAGKSAQVRHLG